MSLRATIAAVRAFTQLRDEAVDSWDKCGSCGHVLAWHRAAPYAYGEDRRICVRRSYCRSARCTDTRLNKPPERRCARFIPPWYELLGKPRSFWIDRARVET